MRVALYRGYGPPEVIQIEEQDAPGPPGPDALLISVNAVGINPADSKSRRGHTPIHPLPAGVGREITGVVRAIGHTITDIEVGSTVIGTGEGLAKETVTLSRTQVTPLPEQVDDETGACLPVAAQTAWVAIESQLVAPGSVVVVSAAAGGVGAIMCQLLVRQGARVIGTASAKNGPYLESLGVTPVVYGKGLARRLSEVAPGGIAHVFDQSGSEMLEAALALGVPRQCINSISGLGPLYGVPTVGRKGLDEKVIRNLAALIATGELVIPITTFPLRDTVKAFQHLDSNCHRGRIALTLP